MDFDVYAIGDGQFIFDIFNAVAAIFGSEDYGGLLKLGLMIGVFSVGVQLVMSGGRTVNIQQIVIALLSFSVLLVPKATANVIDVKTSAVRPVANVPIGLVVMSSITSSAGYFVTNLFETAFSGPAMTQEGFGSALETIKRVRMTTMNEHKVGLVNSLSTGVDVARSWRNYISECTFAAVTSDNKRMTDLVTGDLEDQIEYVSDTAGSQIYIGGAATLGTCRELFGPLRTYTRTAFLPELKARVIAPALDLPADAGMVTTRVNEALDVLGLATVTADDFIITSYLIQPYFAAATETYQTDFKFGYATMVDDAIRARNSQWSAQQTIFERFMQPLMTFLEGFFYAVSPLVFFATMMGIGGSKLLATGVTGLVWLQLWMPTMAVINYFTHSVVAGRMDALPAAGLSLASMSGVFQADDIVQTWLGNAGMLVSSVPVLAGMILYGGAVSLQGLAGRIGGPDTITERQAAPASFNPVTINNVAPLMNTDPVRGQMQTGAAEALATFTVGRQDQRAVDSARREASSATSAFGATLREYAGSSHGSERSSMDAVRNAITSQGQDSRTYNAVFGDNSSLARSIQESYRLSNQERVEVATQLGLQGSLGGSLPGVSGVSGGASMGITERSSDQSATSNERVTQAVRDLQQRFTEDRGWAAQVTSGVAHDISSDHQNRGFSGRSTGIDRDITRRAEDVVSAERTYSDVLSASNSLGAQRTVDGATFARRVQRDEGSRDILDRATAALGLNGAVDRAMASGFATQAFAGDRDAARVYTQLEALAGLNQYAGNMEGVSALHGRAALNEIYGSAFGHGATSFTGGAFDNQGVAEAALRTRLSPGVAAAEVRRLAAGAGGADSYGREVDVVDPVTAFESRFLPAVQSEATAFFRDEVATVRRANEDHDIASAGAAEGPNDATSRQSRENALGVTEGAGWSVYYSPDMLERQRGERFDAAQSMGLPDWGAYYYAMQSTYGMIDRAKLTPESRGKLDVARDIVRGTFQTQGLPPEDADRFMRALDEAARKDAGGAAPLLGQAIDMVQIRGVDSPSTSPSARLDGFRAPTQN